MKNKNYTEKTIIIPIEKWHALSLDETNINVKIQLMGHSMQPLIRREKDFVTIQPLKREPLKGDIVLFKNVDGRYIVHRVKKISGDMLQTMGDNCTNPDKEIEKNEIFGLVTYVHRGKRNLHVDSFVWRLFGQIWLGILPLRKLVKSIFRPAKRMFGRLIG